MALKLIFFSISNQPNRLNELIQDPLSIMFFGGASYHLYFLPLLLVGSSLTLLTAYFSERFGVKILIFFFIISIIVDATIKASGNGFQLGPDIAFESLSKMLSLNLDAQPFARLLFVYIFWILACLPYFFMGIVLNQAFSTIDLSQLFGKSKAMFSLAIFFIANIFGNFFLPPTVKDMIVAYSLLLFGISISQYMNESKQITLGLNSVASSLGVCSFGIYLIHPVLMNFTKLLFSKLELMGQVTIISMLAISLTTFFLSWVAVYQMSNRKWLAKYVFGV